LPARQCAVYGGEFHLAEPHRCRAPTDRRSHDSDKLLPFEFAQEPSNVPDRAASTSSDRRVRQPFDQPVVVGGESEHEVRH
jgi:hypothetical protein